MPRILLLPLDERPCNFLYPALMVEKCTDVQLLLPPKELMGSKKRPARQETGTGRRKADKPLRKRTAAPRSRLRWRQTEPSARRGSPAFSESRRHCSWTW